MADDNSPNQSPSDNNSVPSEYSNILASIRQKSAQPQQAQTSNQGIPQEYLSTLNKVRGTTSGGIDTLAKSVQQAEANVNQDPSDENTKALQSAYENYYKNTNVGQRAAYNLIPDSSTLHNVVQGGKNLVGSALSAVGEAGEGLVTNPLDTLQGIQRGAVTGMGKLLAFPAQAYSAAKQQVYAQAGEPSDIPAAAKMAAERTADTAKLNQALESYKKYGAGMDTREIGEGGMAAANIAENVVPFVAAPESILSKGGAELSEADRAIAAQKALTAANQPSNLGAKIGKFVGGIKGGYQGKLIGETGGSIVDKMFESETPTIKFKTPEDVQNAIEAEKIGVEAYSGDVERLTKELAADPENNDLKKQLYQATLQRNNAASRLNTANEAMGAIQKGVEKAQPSVLGQTAKDALRTGGIFAANAEAQQAPGTSVGGAFGQGATLGGLTTLGVSGGQNIANTVQGFKQGISEELTPAPTPATPQEATVGTPEEKAGTEAPETATPAPVATPAPTKPLAAQAPTTSEGYGPNRVRLRAQYTVAGDVKSMSHDEVTDFDKTLKSDDSPIANAIPVNKGDIESVGHGSDYMYIKFNKPTVYKGENIDQYAYANVPKSVYTEMLNSDDPYAYFQKNIRSQYNTTAINPIHTKEDLASLSNGKQLPNKNEPISVEETKGTEETPAAPTKPLAAQPAPEAPAPFMGSVPAMPPTEATLPPRPSAGEGYATAEQIKQQALAPQKPIAEPAKPLQIQKEPEYQSVSQSKQFQANIQNMQNEIDAKNMELEDIEKSGLADTPQHKLLKQSIDAQKKLMERRIQQFYGTSKPVPNPVLKSFKSP